MENFHMKNKKALALALASVTMAGVAVTAYSTITAHLYMQKNLCVKQNG